MTDEMPDSSRANPFPGLRAFHSDEDYLFFGRDEQTAELATRLRRNRFLAVVGTSGSGKSSLVRAGLIPQLLAGGMRRAGSSWEVAVMRPGGRPIARLADALCEADLYDRDMEGVLANLEVTLARSRLGLIEAVRQSDIEEDTNLLVVVDQFEEIFRFRSAGAAAEEQAYDFVNLLLEASALDDAPIYIVITMRSDFIGDCSQFAGLAEGVNRGEYLIPRLTREQCRAAIEGPIRVAGGEVTPQLVQRVLNDLGPDQDRLPVLQHALMRTWDAWQADPSRGEALDLCHYEATGGMREALSRHADEVFDELPDDRHRRVAERLFKALTERGADNREVRRPARLGVLAEITGASDAELRAVIESYRRTGRTFLMPVEQVLEPQTVIDISHESLMRVWRRLQGWVEEEAQSARVYRRLADTAHLHAQGKAGLFRDPDLQIALAWRRESEPNAAWASRYHEGFEEAKSFLDESEAAERAELEAREAARQHELEQARVLAATQARAARNFKRFAAGVSVLALVAIVLSIWAFVLKERAEESEARADASAKAAEASRVAAVAARSEAEESREEAVAARDRAIHEQGRVWLERARFLLEEKRFLGAKLLAARALGFEGFGREARDDAFRAKYPVLLRRESDDWKSAEPLIRDLPEYPTVWMSPTPAQAENSVLALEFSSDGATLATTNRSPGSAGFSLDGRIRIWDLASGAVRLEIPASDVAPCVALSPAESLLAFANRAGGVSTIHIRNASTGEEVRRIEGTWSWVYDLAFSPDGETLAAGCVDGSVRLWEVASGREVGVLRGGWRLVYSVAFAPDGKTLAFGANDRLGLWNLREPSEPPVSLQEDTGVVSDVEFSRDARLLASAMYSAPRSGVGSIRIWDVETRATLRVLPSGPGAVSLHPGGKLITAAGRDGALRLWELETGTEVAVFEGAQGVQGGPSQWTMWTEIDFSPDGRLLGWTQGRNFVAILDVESRTMRNEAAGHTGPLTGVSWSPDGLVLASCGTDETVRLWSAGSGEELARFDTTHPLDVAFSPGGTTLAVTNAEGNILLYDPAKRAEIAVLTGHEGDVSSVAFDGSGTRLASGSHDGSVRLWDFVDGAWGPEVARLEHGDEVFDVAFGRDGLLASSGADRKVRLWDVRSKQEVRVLEGHGGGIQALAFSPDGALLASGSSDRTVRLWDVGSGQERARLEGHSRGIGGLSFSPDGTTLASSGVGSDQSVRLWDVSTQSHLASLEGHSRGVTDVAFGPDGRTLASAGAEGSVRLWDASRSEVSRFESPGEAVFAVAYRSKDRLVASGTRSGSILLRDAVDGRRLRSLEGHSDNIEDLAFDAHRLHLASASRDRTVRLWHVATGKEIWTSDTFGNWVRSVDFSPDGTLLAAACDDRVIRLLDVVTGRVVRVLSGHGDFVPTAVFTPDGTRIVSASSDQTIRLWDVKSGRELSRIQVDSQDSDDGLELHLHPNGRLLASCEGSGVVRLWDVEQGVAIAALESAGASVGGVSFSPDGKLLAALGPGELRLWDVDSRQTVMVVAVGGAEERYFPWQAEFSADGRRIAFGDSDGIVHIVDARWRPRGSSRLAEQLDWFAIEGRGDLRPTLPRSLYRPARIELESPSAGSHLGILRRWKDRGEGEGMWRELFHQYLGAGNVEGAALLVERLPREASESERALLAAALVAEAERDADRPESFVRVTGLLDRAEQLAPGLPRAFAVRALALEARGDSDGADQALERGVSLALELGEAARTELLWLVDQRVTRHLRRGEIARAGEAVEVVLGLPDVSPVSRSLLLDRYWQAIRGDALERYRAGEPVAARSAALAEILRWAAGETPIEKAAAPLFDALEELDTSREGVSLVDRGSTWKYLDDGSDPGAAWRAPEFDDGAWPSGPAPLGFGDRRERTRIRRNLEGDPTTGSATAAFYLRHRFEVGALDEAVTSLVVELARDDGAVVYLNGEEIVRDGMPEGRVDAQTFASVIASGNDETRLWKFRVRTDRLREGSNVLAAEVHQANVGSSDLHFELGLAIQRPAWVILGLDDPAVVEESLEAALSLLPPALREQRAEALRFALADTVESPRLETNDPELWRLRARVQASLGNEDALLDALRRELASLEASKEALSAPRLSDLRAEIAKRLEARGRSDEAASWLRQWFEAEKRACGALRINCGGSAFIGSDDTLWNSDAFCRVGSSVSFDGAVLGSADPALHAQVREFPVGEGEGYRLPLPDGLYRVRLHLAETVSSTAGRRVFDVLLQGDVVVDGYDCLRSVGFEMQDLRNLGARVEGGVLEIAFRPQSGSTPARVAALEIAPVGEDEYGRLVRAQDDGLWARDALEEHGAVRINSGAVVEYHTADGRVWSRDRCYVGGRGPSRSSAISPSFARAIEKTEDDPLYLTERYFPGSPPFAYRVPLPAGRYRVSLHFAELWAPFREAGERVFDVLLEGARVLEGYDISGAVGYATPDVRTFEVDVEDGHLDIEFTQRSGGESKISAIEIEPLGD